MDPGPRVNPDPRRMLPSVDRLARAGAEARPDLPTWALAEAARRTLAAARAEIEGGGHPEDPANMLANCLAEAEGLAAPHPRRVVNATGVLLHTNLGRAPLAPGATRAAAEAAAGYSDLELDLRSGARGDRGARVAARLVQLSGAEAAAAFNNNAAAVLLALDTLARGREVVVSRGELVEIGGSFRVPEIMERGGVRLVEVGTTNRTHLGDYEAAIGPATALLLKVHRSNFEQRGFVAEVGLGELAALGRRRGIPVMEDLGSGTLLDLGGLGFPRETFAPGRLALGADLVCFSGDKLLGGPQSGIVLGRAEIVQRMRRNPLARALRLDKLGLAALDWTLSALLDGRGEREIPLLVQLLLPLEQLEVRARALAERLSKAEPIRAAGLEVRVESDRAPVGGGSWPGFELETRVVALRGGDGPERLAGRLRAAPTPVIARVRDDALLLDLRSVAEAELEVLAGSVERALR